MHFLRMEGYMAVCKNCGAEIGENETTCKYCGAVQYEAANKEYWDQMEKIQDDLEKLEEVPQKEWKKEVGIQAKRIRKIFISGAVVILLCVSIGTGYSYFSQKKEDQLQKEQLLWQKEAFAKLDAWFEEENYDAIVDFHMQLLEANSPYHLWNWEHMNVIECYEDITVYRETVNELTEEKIQETGTQDIQYALENVLYLTFRMQRRAEEEFSMPEEWEKVLEYKEEVKKQTCEIFGWDEAEFDRMKTELSPDGYIDFDKCEEYAKQWLKQKKKN